MRGNALAGARAAGVLDRRSDFRVAADRNEKASVKLAYAI